MEEIKKLLVDTIDDDFVQAIISNPKEKGGVLKVKIRPMMIKCEKVLQCESFTKTQAFHENVAMSDAAERIESLMQNFKQMQMTTCREEVTVLVSKKGKVTIQRKKQKQKIEKADLSHNRNKKYILQEGIAVPFLQDLGVMTAEGKIVRTKFDKFRQINRFLEFIEDILPQLDKKKEVTILDFGCGKSYLTFAMYYYLHELQGYDIRIIGLDLKKDVIKNCNQLSEKYGYDKLAFLEGDIADYEGVDSVDMVVTLHACDTATDYALAKAIGWNAKVILSVPCCQHELNKQIQNDQLSPILDYGLLKERFAALLTDGLRAKYLENAGYETQVLEFIDMEHTPKNILLRGVKKKEGAEKLQCSDMISQCEELFHVKPTLGSLLAEQDR